MGAGGNRHLNAASTRLESGCQTGRRGYHLAVVLEDVCKVKETLKLLQGGRSGPETVFPAE